MLKKYRVRDYDFKLIIMLIAITVVGILVIGSADRSYQSKQILGFVMGLFLMVVISLFDYSTFLNFYWIIYIGNLVLLLLVEFFGEKSNNAQRWVSIAGIRFQPSETAKILLILFYAQYIMKHKETISSLKTIISMLVLLSPPLLLIYRQPDLSTTIMIALLFCVLLFMGGLSYKIIFGVLAIAVPLFVIFLTLVLQPDQTLLKDYQQTRILAWLNPQEYAQESYQQQNAVMAIGSGRLSGKGLYNEGPLSVKNGNYIPEPQTDFIMAVIGEELGFLGSAAVILLLFSICLTCIAIGRRASDTAGQLYCAGFGFLVGIQGFVNICVASGLMPNTGLTLPFVSYGLSSLLALCIGAGIVINVGADRREGR